MPPVLRVVHLLSADLWAGAEVATLHLLDALHRRSDVDVRVIALNPGAFAARAQERGIAVQIVPEALLGPARLLREIRRRTADADLLHSHRYKENLLAALSGRPWVSTQHGRPEPLPGLASVRMGVYLRLDRIAKRRSARRVVAVSQEVETWCAERFGRARTVRAWNGILDPRARVGPAPWPERPLRVGVLGRLAPVKGFDLAIDTLARCPGVELDIVGEGSDRAALEARIGAAGAGDRIQLVGHEPDPLPRLASWRALLVTSLHEGNPIAVLEAMALGTPVLAGPLPGVAEALAGRGGWILPDRDPERWARRLGELARDEAAGSTASEAARERFLSAFTAERAADRIARIYRAALGVAAGDSRRGGHTARSCA